MKLKHCKQVISSQTDGMHPISGLSWSQNNSRLAVSTSDKSIHLFDDMGDRKDKFTVKPQDQAQNNQNFKVIDIAFSPDSAKIAVAQSDQAIFVYKIGLEWGEKKSICNKFIIGSDITCLSWPSQQPNNVLFGSIDGKVRMGNTRTNKPNVLYEAESAVITIATNPEGNAIISGHVDGTLCRFYFDPNTSATLQGRLATHKCPPFAIVWGETILVGGNDRKIVIYGMDGRQLQCFDYSASIDLMEFTTATINPIGQTAVFGAFNALLSYNYSVEKRCWVEGSITNIPNLYSVTSLAWKSDGSKVTVGSLCGGVDLFDCSLRKVLYKDKFEFIYTSASQVIVRQISTGIKVTLSSMRGFEIKKLNVYNDQYLIGNTTETLLCGDIDSGKLSEISWMSAGNEKYFFDSPTACVIYNAGELVVVEYGSNEITGICRTEHVKPGLISIRINERKSSTDIKCIAYLMDAQTIQIQNLLTGTTIATINHNCKIDWLELSGKASKLLFRDRRHQLMLYDVENDQKTTILNYCSYVQWVPQSDVIVAQNRNQMCIWYSINQPDKISIVSIKGDIETIEKVNGTTFVVIDEGMGTTSIPLDEALIEFGTAIEDNDYQRAITLLESQENSAETEAMWKTLGQIAIKEKYFAIAERCFFAFGDVATGRYLKSINDLAEEIYGPIKLLPENYDHFSLRAKMAILNKQFQLAETIYLENGKMDDAMEMYQELHKWDQAIKVAEVRNHPELDKLRAGYFSWLVESGQSDKAAEIKQNEGDFVAAIQLLLNGGFPARAASLLSQHQHEVDHEVAERIATALFNAGLYEKAGDFFEKLGQNERAVEAYKKGHCYRKAIEITRKIQPKDVVVLEETWGDYLCSIKQLDAAVNHYIEAGKNLKAADTAIQARQWKKASSIIETIYPADLAKPFHFKLGVHYRDINDYSNAERHFLQIGRAEEVVDMYFKAKNWDKAYMVASEIMSSDEIHGAFVNEAKKLEAEKNLIEAEKVYLSIHEADLAINMYKTHRDYDQMMRLVSIHHKDLVKETRIFLAKGLEAEGSFKQAVTHLALHSNHQEFHYLQADDWKSTLNMYCTNNMYEDAYRVAKSKGGSTAGKQVAYLWARSLGGESASKLLMKLGVLDAAIEFASENAAFDFAFELCRLGDPSKEPEVYYKQAMYFEDEGKFKEAEAAFIKSGKPREAILMHVHNQDWRAAQAVAEKYDPSSLTDVLVGQAKISMEGKDYSKMESLLLRAQKPELVVKFYQELNMWSDAIRFAEEYLPSAVQEIRLQYEQIAATGVAPARAKAPQSAHYTSSQPSDVFTQGKNYEQQQEYSKAIDTYMKLDIQQTADVNQLEKAWNKAVDLTFKFVPSRVNQVVLTIAQRFINIDRIDAAAELYIDIEKYQEALDLLIQSKQWDRARQVANEYAPRLKSYVEQQYESKNAKGSLAPNDEENSIQKYAENGNWEECLRLAKASGNKEKLVAYLDQCITSFKNANEEENAIPFINQAGVPYSKSIFETYARLFQKILSKTNVSPEKLEQVKQITSYLIDTNKDIKDFDISYSEKQLWISHILSKQRVCESKADLYPLYAKQCVSLLRYCDILTPDRIFFEAGEACKKAEMEDMAYVFFNRFLDICDAMEDHSGDIVSEQVSDLEGTDIPFQFRLPNGPSIAEEKKEKARDWVLSMSLDPKEGLDLAVQHRECEACGKSIYEASLFCNNCEHSYDKCCVTGYPVLMLQAVECTSCHRKANRDDWNRYVMVEKTCPWCNVPASTMYSLK